MKTQMICCKLNTRLAELRIQRQSLAPQIVPVEVAAPIVNPTSIAPGDHEAALSDPIPEKPKLAYLNLTRRPPEPSKAVLIVESGAQRAPPGSVSIRHA